MKSQQITVDLPYAETSVSASKPMSLRRRLALWLALTFGLIVLLPSLAFHAYIAWILGRPDIDQLTSDPLHAAGLPFETVRFPGQNSGTTLEGWYIPADGAKRTVVFSHGYGGNREEIWVPIYDLAAQLNRNQYNVIMFDYAYVTSEERVSGGIREAYELLGAVEYARQRGAEQVYVWGFSMGAGTALQAALKSDAIDGMILDSTFLLNRDTLYHNLRGYVPWLPEFPSVPLVCLFFPLVNDGFSIQQIPYNTIMSTLYEMPIFFIHGAKDQKAPVAIIESLYETQKINRDSSLWILPDGTHELLYRIAGDDYLMRTIAFLNQLSDRSETLPVIR